MSVRAERHDHAHHDEVRSGSRRALVISFLLLFGFMVAEVVAGFLANSLALLADALHMVTDLLSIALALGAIWVAQRPPSARLTFGFYRAEVLAALVNAVSLWFIAGWIFFEAYRRFAEPPEVQGILTLGVGVAGLLANVASAMILRRSARESLNVEGAFLHVIGDLLGSVGVVVAGSIIILTGWYVADPIIGVFIGVLVLLSSGRLLWRVLHVLMEATPAGVDLLNVCRRLEKEPGVTGVHDLHVWSLTSGYEVMSAHVTTDRRATDERRELLDRLRDIASQEFGVSHVTIQLEEDREGCGERHHIPHE